jgi:hypothetical protein
MRIVSISLGYHGYAPVFARLIEVLGQPERAASFCHWQMRVRISREADLLHGGKQFLEDAAKEGRYAPP